MINWDDEVNPTITINLTKEELLALRALCVIEPSSLYRLLDHHDFRHYTQDKARFHNILRDELFFKLDLDCIELYPQRYDEYVRCGGDRIG